MMKQVLTGIYYKKLFHSDTLKIQYDKTGLIISADKDVTKLFPLNCSVVEFADTDIPDDFQPGNFTYSNGTIALFRLIMLL